MPPLALRYLVVIAAVSAITVLVFIGAGRAIGDQHRTEERESVKGAAAAIAYRSAVAEATLEDIAVLFEASQEVTRTEFGRFASTALRRPAIRSIGWLPRVHGATGRRRFERSRNLRLTTFGNGGRPVTAPPAPQYFPLDYLVSGGSGTPVPYGFDSSTEPNRRRTMQAAAMLGRPVATPPLDLATGPHLPLYYMPVYDPRLAHRTAGERAEALRGFIVASIDTTALMRATIDRLPGSPAVRITDGARPVATSRSKLGRATSATVAVGGRPWRVDVAVSRSDVADRLRWAILGVGLVLVGALWTLFKRGADQTARAERLVAQRTAQLEQRNARLVELDAFKDQVMGLVSHDLRSPLTAISGYVGLLLDEDGGPLNQEQRGWLDITRRSADRLERRIDDLLLVSRAKDGQVHADRSPTRVDAIAQDIVEAAMPQAARKSLELVVDAPRCIANVDGNLLSQALDNLLSNAIKYTPDGGRVSVHVELVEDALEVRVADTGIGIAPELLDEVFEPFMRTPQAVEHGIRGTGLGLVTVKAVAEAHGGTTSVKSAPGRGTTFTLSLPAHAEAEPPASSAPSLASVSRAGL